MKRVRPNQLCRVINPERFDFLEKHVGRVVHVLEPWPNSNDEHGGQLWKYAAPLLEIELITPVPGGLIIEDATVQAMPEFCLEPLDDGDPNQADMELLKIPAPTSRPKETA